MEYSANQSALDPNKVASEVLVDLAKSVAKTICGKIHSYLKDAKNKDEIELGDAFIDYLRYAQNKYRKIKTLLYLHEPRDLYSFYECIGLLCKNENVDTSDINNVLSLGHRLIITGSGGMGKSVMMKHFLINSICKTRYIPILVELRGLNEQDSDNINLSDYIYKVLCTLNFRLEKKYFEYGLSLGCFVILFDGYDEVKNQISAKVSTEIRNFCDKYSGNYFILSSRPLQEFIDWNNFLELSCMPLNMNQALSLVNKLDYEPIVKQKFCEELKNGLFEKYSTFASNPLLLTIMLLTFESRASIPDKLNDFYEQAFVVLFNEHDATKGSYKRDILSKLGYEDFRMVFSYFCFKSFFKSQFEFTESQALELIGLANQKKVIKQPFDNFSYLNDLTNAVCMLVREGLSYKFAHRSFQEYFAAVYTAQLSDSKQERFLKSWMNDKNYRGTSDYLDMLYDLEPTRFVNNVIYPGLKMFKSQYEAEGMPDDWALQTLSDGIVIQNRYTEGKKTKQKLIAVRISNDYYYEILTRSLNMIGYQIPKTDQQRIQEEETKVLQILEEKYGHRKIEISFSQLKEDKLYDMVLPCLVWNQWRFASALRYFESLEKQKKKRLLSFNSIFDEI